MPGKLRLLCLISSLSFTCCHTGLGLLQAAPKDQRCLSIMAEGRPLASASKQLSCVTLQHGLSFLDEDAVEAVLKSTTASAAEKIEAPSQH